MEIISDERTLNTDSPARSPSRLGLRRPPLQRHFSFGTLPIDFTEDADDDAFSLGDVPTCFLMITSKKRIELPENSGIDNSSSDEDEDDDEELASHTNRFQFLNSDLAPLSHESMSDNAEDSLFFDPSDSYGDFFFGTSSIPDHGLSDSALRLVKKMWSTRQDEWESWKYQVDALKSAATVYDGLAETSDNLSFPRPTLDILSPPPQPQLSLESPAQATNSETPIFPRFGNISRIRDPMCVTVDRAFCTIPIHTIQKAFYYNDMIHRLTQQKTTPTSGEHRQETDTSRQVDLDTSSWSDDESTLVESETSPYLFSKVPMNDRKITVMSQDDCLKMQLEFLDNLRQVRKAYQRRTRIVEQGNGDEAHDDE